MVTDTECIVEQLAPRILDEILKGGYIRPVYQPIVSLTDGSIFGYEALSRISNDGLKMNIDEMFRTADKVQKAWELESLCREKTLQNAINLGVGKKLFINVNPNIIHDIGFKNGFTKKRLEEYGLDFQDIIFEITERVVVADKESFLSSIAHYKSQNYGIAVDDVGSGYSGLNTLSDIKPNFIKLDMNIVRGIDKDETKQLLCKAMVDFANHSDIKVIAEGIETEEELETLMKLNVDLGQGYFLGIPEKSFVDTSQEIVEIIDKYRVKKYVEKTKSSIYPKIGNLSKQGNCFPANEMVGCIYETMKNNPTITEFTVLEGNVAIGFMTRTNLNEILGGKYGFTLHSEKMLRQIMKIDFLRVNYNMPIDQVSRLAMQRPFDRLYDPIVVEKNGKYSGTVTVKDLLDTCTKIEVDVAAHCNPLTHLPGNLLIEKEIMNRIFGTTPYCIVYFDVDNFKAYNDAYGFQNGDMMLALFADILKKCADKNEFIGHIGGDDFIVICDYHEGEQLCSSIIDDFSSQVISLYRDEDVKNGYIISKNRNGVTENFPIASLSIAGISNKINTYQDVDDFSKDIAQIKKKCKQHVGNYFEIH